MKIAFFGTPEFVCEFLEELKKCSFTPELVVTGPDVPVGRKLEITSPAPKHWADSNRIRVLQPAKIDESFIENIAQENWDIFIVVAYGKILPEKLIHLPKYGTINVHYSLLPLYRGATPVETSLLNQDTETGVCIQHMVYELDAGAILATEKTKISPTENHHELRARLNTIAKPMLIDVLSDIENKINHKTEQDHSKKIRCGKIQKTDGLIDLNENSAELFAKYKAYFGWPGLYFYQKKVDKEIRVKITEASLENNVFIIKKVIPEGKKEISFETFVRQ